MKHKAICPRCSGAVPNAQHAGEYRGALSRFDSQTEICSNCGTEEALFSGHLIPFDVPLDGDGANEIIRLNREIGMLKVRLDEARAKAQ